MVQCDGTVDTVQEYGCYGTRIRVVRARVVPNPHPSYPQTRTPKKKHKQIKYKTTNFPKLAGLVFFWGVRACGYGGVQVWYHPCSCIVPPVVLPVPLHRTTRASVPHPLYTCTLPIVPLYRTPYQTIAPLHRTSAVASLQKPCFYGS